MYNKWALQINLKKMKKDIEKMENYLNEQIISLAQINQKDEIAICLILQLGFLANPKQNKEEIAYLDYWIKEAEEEKNLSNKES